MTDRVAVDTAHSISEALDRLRTDEFDCVLSAYRLPDEDGVTFLRQIRDFDSGLPFVLCVADGTERVASEAISAGVTDYVRNEPGVDQAETVAARVRDAVSEPAADHEPEVRELTDATEDVLWLISGDWEEVLFVNSAYATVWGHPEAKLREDPTSFLDAVHPDDRPRAEAAVKRLTGGDSVEVELRVDPTGDFRRHVSVQAEPIFDRDGSVTRIAGVSREVTEQRARQRVCRAKSG